MHTQANPHGTADVTDASSTAERRGGHRARGSARSLGMRIAERLPEIMIEALFMLVAVVLAFAVEEWREERELDGLAAERAARSCRR